MRADTRNDAAIRAMRFAAMGVLVTFLGSTAALAMMHGGPAINYIEATPAIATAGMPTRSQLHELAAAHAAVINLAPTGAYGSHDDEQAIVEGAGARYVHVPVDFGAPQPADYDRFARELGAFAGQKVFVHCQMNMRASVFVFLYRVIELGEDAERAFDDVQKVWTPNRVWRRLALDVLKSRGFKAPVALG